MYLQAGAAPKDNETTVLATLWSITDEFRAVGRGGHRRSDRAGIIASSSSSSSSSTDCITYDDSFLDTPFSLSEIIDFCLKQKTLVVYRRR
jgi:hypothetical protein